MKLKKGDKLEFKSRTETIIKASNDRVKGSIITDLNEYSTDFIFRWIEFGFLKVI
jgi:hypothetical protein